MTMYIHKKIDLLQFQDSAGAANKLLSDAVTTVPLTIFLECSVESNSSPVEWLHKLGKVVECVRSQRPDGRIFFLADAWWKYFDSDVVNIGFNDVLYTDTCLYKYYHEIVKKHCAPVVYRWPSNSKKFLFLTGRPEGANRIRLLHKFVQRGLIDQCEWSLHLSFDRDVLERKVHKSVPELSVIEFRNFINTYKRNPDNITMTQMNHAITYNGLHYDVGLYLNTCFTVVPETSFKDTQYPFLTEKIWKSIINKHPFILAGDTHSLEKLNSMGFVTFEQYLPIKDYANIINTEQRLDAIVDNTEYLINNIYKHRDQIAAAVKHNSTVIDELYCAARLNIQNFIDKHQLEIPIEELIDTVNFKSLLYTEEEEQQPINDSNFVNFYNSVKGDNWPECQTEDDYNLLPGHIQIECQEVFGYVPK